MGAYGRIIENARGAQLEQPHARLRWRVPWGAANGRAKVPSILGASEIREHERACIGSKATVHMYGLNPPYWLVPKGENSWETLRETKNVLVHYTQGRASAPVRLVYRV